MIIPSLERVQCAARSLSPRDVKSVENSVKSTAESFKSWDTCMDNKTCKIVAIVGIVLAALVILWLVCGIINCVCCGVRTCAGVFCCCLTCCRGPRQRGHGRELSDVPESSPFNNSAMYPPKPVTAYQGNGSTWNANGYAPVQQPAYYQNSQLGRGVAFDESDEKFEYGKGSSYGNRNNKFEYS